MRRPGVLTRLLAVLAVVWLAFGWAAEAADLGPPLADIASGKFDRVERGIDGLATSGDQRAAAIIEALRDGRLLAGRGAVVVRDAAGAFTEAATGASRADAAGLRPVRVNNRIRRAVEAAMGGLTLLSPDPDARLAAAAAVLRSRDVSLLPTLDTALARETDDTVRRSLEDARAAIVVAKVDAPEADRIAAVATLARRGDQDVLAILTGVQSDAPPALRAAADAATAGIQRQQQLLSVAQNVAYGVSLGSVLLLAAIGLAVTFGVMGVINMAHGEMVMLGAYTTYVLQEACRNHLPAALPWSLPVAVPLAFLVAGAVGVLIERTVIRRLYGRALETLLATWGISLILQQAVRSIFGPNNREVSTPSWMSGSFEVASGFSFTWNRLVIFLFCIAVFLSLLLVIRLSRLGLEMRAVTQNRRMAASMGIRTERVDALTFGLGSGIAGIAGVALSQIDNVSPNLGQSYIIDSFLVVVFGGVGNLWGTLTGALTLGIVNKLLEPTVGAVLGKILVLVAIILFIQKRPRGLFAQQGRAVEA